MPSLKQRTPEVMHFDGSVRLIAYHQKSKIAETNNLFNDFEMPASIQDSEEEEEDLTYYPYLKQEINLHLVCDTSAYESRRSLMPNVAHLFSLDHWLGLYDPIVYLSDFWVLMRDLILLD